MKNLMNWIVYILVSYLTFVSPAYGVSTVEESSYTSSDSAKENLVSDFREHALAIPKSLVNLGEDEFGRLDLNELIDQIKSIEIHAKEWFVVSLPNDNERISGFWHKSSPSPGIDFNILAWKAAPENIKDLIALHEALGFLNFNDDNYNLTISLWFFLNQKQNPIINDDQFELIENNIIYLAGGVTGVGGGGDFGGIATKKGLIENALNDQSIALDQKGSAVMLQYQLAMAIKIEIKWKRGSVQGLPAKASEP